MMRQHLKKLSIQTQAATGRMNKLSIRAVARNLQRTTIRTWISVLLGFVLPICLLQLHRSLHLKLSNPNIDDPVALIPTSTLRKKAPSSPTASTRELTTIANETWPLLALTKLTIPIISDPVALIPTSTLSGTSSPPPTASTRELPTIANETWPLNSHQDIELHQADTESPGMEWIAPHLDILYRRNTSKTNPRNCNEECLLNATVPYYVYPEHLLFSDKRFYLSNLTGNDFKTVPFIRPIWHRSEITWEVDIIRTLLNHSIRTDSYENAELFIIPVSFTAIFFDEKYRSSRDVLFEEIRLNLQNSTAFQMGKPHVLVSMTTLFNKHYNQIVGKAMSRLYDTLQTVAVARSDDLISTQYAYLNNVTPTKGFRGFEDVFSIYGSVTEYQFCVGLGGEALHHLPLIAPTWEKFQNATFFVFYHTRTTPSICNSTEFRHAPILNVSLDALPHSSIGFDIQTEQWKREFVDSKFCLVIRGDIPQSHALFNAIKVGCIPVMICDWCLLYSPPFPTRLDMRDFCIFLPEGMFLSNPQKSLQSLQDIPNAVLKSKLRALEWAQRVTMMDHPHSLFVPAFVGEAMASLQRPVSEVLRVIKR